MTWVQGKKGFRRVSEILWVSTLCPSCRHPPFFGTRPFLHFLWRERAPKHGIEDVDDDKEAALPCGRCCNGLALVPGELYTYVQSNYLRKSTWWLRNRTRKSYTGRPMSLLIPRALLAKCSTHLRGCSAFLICSVSCTRGHTSHEDPDPFICPQVTRITHMTHGNAVTHPLAFVLHPSYHRHRTHPRERKHVESRSCIARRLVIHHPPESLLSENCTM